MNENKYWDESDPLFDLFNCEPEGEEDHYLEVIKVVKYVEILPHEKGELIDAIFDKEGWQLQLVVGANGKPGYQLFFGQHVQVDNYWEYGFPYLYGLDEVLEHAESFLHFRKAVN